MRFNSGPLNTAPLNGSSQIVYGVFSGDALIFRQNVGVLYEGDDQLLFRQTIIFRSTFDGGDQVTFNQDVSYKSLDQDMVKLRQRVEAP